MKVFFLLLILASQALSSTLFTNSEVSPSTTVESDDRSVNAAVSRHACRLCTVKNRDPRILLSHLQEYHTGKYLDEFYRPHVLVNASEEPIDVFVAADGPQVPCSFCKFPIPERYMELHKLWYHSEYVRNLLIRRLGRENSLEPLTNSAPVCKVKPFKSERSVKPKPKRSPKLKPKASAEEIPDVQIPSIDVSVFNSGDYAEFDEEIEKSILDSLK